MCLKTGSLEYSRREFENDLAIAEDSYLAQRIVAIVIGDGQAGERVTEAHVGGAEQYPSITRDIHAANRVAAEFNAVAKIIF